MSKVYYCYCCGDDFGKYNKRYSKHLCKQCVKKLDHLAIQRKEISKRAKEKYKVIEKISLLILQHKDANLSAVKIMSWLEKQKLLKSNTDNFANKGR